MPLISFSRTGDDTILEHINALNDIGADLTIQTTEDNGSLIRVATVTWKTHTDTGRLLS